MQTELPAGNWGAALADLTRANMLFENAEAMDDIQRTGADLHAAAIRLIATPAPDMRALVAKLEAARLDTDEIMDGTLDLIIADARRLAGLSE